MSGEPGDVGHEPARDRRQRPTRAITLVVALAALVLAVVLVASLPAFDQDLVLSTAPPSLSAAPSSRPDQTQALTSDTPRPESTPRPTPFPTSTPRPTVAPTPRPSLTPVATPIATLPGTLSPEEELARTTPGTMALDAPARITQRAAPVLVIVRVAPGPAVPTASLSARASLSPTTVSRVMEAQLTGSDFKIEPLPGNGPQLVGDAATWEWLVSSTRAGRHTLRLTTLIVVAVAGVEVRKAITADTRDIDVDVDPGWQVEDFADRNWQWMLTAGALPIIGWLWQRRARKATSARRTRTRRR